MPVKIVVNTETGNTVVVGGRTHTPKVNRPKLKYADYSLHRYNNIIVPSMFDYSAKALPALRQMYLNNELGDCVPAMGGHAIGTFTGNSSGSPVILTSAQIIAIYSKWGGYIPGNPGTDQGCSIGQSLQYWKQFGVPLGSDHKLVTLMSVDSSNPGEIEEALYLFENLIYGVDLPDAWITPFPSTDGFVWDAAGASDPSNGHCFLSTGRDTTTKRNKIWTWGMFGWVTDAATDQYCDEQDEGELYCVLTPDIILAAQNKSPAGVYWKNLLADFKSEAA